MVRKSHLTPLRKGGQIIKHGGKGASEQILPDRHALSTLTSGDPSMRTMQNYAKASPMAPPDADTPNILGE